MADRRKLNAKEQKISKNSGGVNFIGNNIGYFADYELDSYTQI